MIDYNTILEKAIEDFLAYSQKDVNDAVAIAFNTILKVEQDEFLGYLKGSRSDKETENKRNGYRSKLVQGINTAFDVRIPRDRLGQFKPLFLELVKDQRYRLDDIAFTLYSKGLTTRDIEEVFQSLYKHKYSRSSISRITGKFTEYREQWQNRALDNDWYLVFIDALRIKVRRDRVSNETFYIALGLKSDLTRDVLGVWTLPEETQSGWDMVLSELKDRGVENVLCFVADGFKGLNQTVSKHFPRSDFQRCLVHKLRNVMSKVRKDDKPEVISDFKKVFELENPLFNIPKGRTNLNIFIDKWAKKYSSFINMFLEEEIEDYLQYAKYPTGIQRMMYTTNWSESENKNVRRTVKIRGSFPTEDSAMNLVCTCLMDRCENNLNKYKITSLLDCKDRLDILMEERKKSFYPLGIPKG